MKGNDDMQTKMMLFWVVYYIYTGRSVVRAWTEDVRIWADAGIWLDGCLDRETLASFLYTPFLFSAILFQFCPFLFSQRRVFVSSYLFLASMLNDT